MPPVLDAANAARDATKGILATCSNPATIDRRKDRGAPPANYSTAKYQIPTFDNHCIVPMPAEASVTTRVKADTRTLTERTQVVPSVV